MTHADRMTNHWWWRPGWGPGSRFFTFHFTFRQANDLHRLAAEYRRALADVDGLDLVPDESLHLTTQGLDFTDRVPDGDLRAILTAAQHRLAALPAFDLTVHRPEITPEAVRWEAAPSGPPAAVRTALRDAIGTVWKTVPEPADGFGPHVTIAYSSADGPAAPVRAALDTVKAAPVTVHVDHVELIVLHRDRQMYEWEAHTQLPLSG
ncbi:2'-5' RNA ligase family protein (plasmid) [Streptomyces sp. P9-2B-2]|uniref:2'-5' RNA ligase family protein n=1 Tax=Streptomyces sp. P9-2B-2 TaxID=3057114 RepID=UPI0025B3DD9C|nr:2'-5' RNA ligase family protein [Streptomyces sp. P9-2B-2]WJY43265.1 2'-5' RNA ligase family protein [Streptomyces sp. P9-2B-2]